MPPQDYVIKTATNTYRIRVPDGMDPDKALSLAAATNEGFAQEYGALQAHQKTMLSDQMKPYEFGGPSVGRPPGGGEEAMLAEGAPPAAEALTTIGTAGALKANPIGALRALAGGAAGAYAGGHGGKYLGGLIGAPEAGETVGALGGGLLGGYAGGAGIPIHGKGQMLESIFAKTPPPPPPEFPGASLPAAEDFYMERGKEFDAARKLNEKALATQAKSAKVAAKAAPPPDRFAGMVSTAPGAVPTGATLPEVPQGQPTPFPTVARKGGVSAPPTVEAPQTGGPLDLPTGKQPNTLLSRGQTLIQPGMEPDMNNPVHAKMIGDLQGQGLSIKELKAREGLGDRFAAYVLRYMRRPKMP